MLKHALEKVKVVDLSSYIAGSFCPTLLADLGADVIKLESPAGDPFRMSQGAFQAWNRGKRSISVDLRTDEGGKILYKLVTDSDVVVENYRPGVAKRLRADYDTLSRINPALIYCSISGYGQTGPYSKKPGFDPLLQARSGAMARQGGPERPPIFLAVAISDYSAAMLGAWGIAMALFARARTGKGQWVETSLVNATMAIQSGRFILLSGKSEADEDGGGLGPTPTYRCYPTADGWIFIAARNDDEWTRLVRSLGREELARDQRFDTQAKRLKAASELGALLEDTFAREVSSHWLERLETDEVLCAPVNYFDDLFDHPQVRRNGLVVEHDSRDIGTFRQIGVPIMLSRTPGIARCAAPALGQHTDEILGELGYSLEEITRLHEKKVVY
ncbi:MAG: CaiB/BaiF CoA transferase family protein [Dehalococcoidia bacterium]